MNETREEYEGLINALKLEDLKVPSIVIPSMVNLYELSNDVVLVLFDELKKATEYPDIAISRLAKMQLGRLLITRFNDISSGLDWWTQAAEEGDPLSQNYLGGWYLNEENTEFDLSKAVFWLEKSADQGYAKSQHTLGAIYHQGIGVIKDVKKSILLFEKAAEQGNTESQFMLGTLYMEGNAEAPKNINKALEWLQKASEQNQIQAQSTLANYYVNENDMEKAFCYFNLAANNGDGNSLLSVAVMYRDGIGTQQNIDKALEFFIEATKNENLDVSRKAKSEIGCIYNGTLRIVDKAIYWWEKAATEGDMKSQYNLAIAYAWGDEGVSTDAIKAEMWLKKLREQEHREINEEDILNINKQILFLKVQAIPLNGIDEK